MRKMRKRKNKWRNNREEKKRKDRGNERGNERGNGNIEKAKVRVHNEKNKEERITSLGLFSRAPQP